MHANAPANLDSVKTVLVEVLGMEDRSDSITAETRLFGSLPELDSLTVVELILALEERFGITVDEDDVSAETFETLATLTDFVSAKTQPAS